MTTEAGPAEAARPLRASGLTVELPGAPEIPGLIIRRWRDESDLIGWAGVVNGSWSADGVVIRTGPASEGNEMRNLTGFELERDLLLVERGGEIVGFVRTNVDTEDDGTRRHWTSMMLAPGGRGIGLDDVLVDWAEANHRALAAAEGGTATRRLGVWAAEQETWWVEHAVRRGYRPARWFTEMVRDSLEDLPVCPLPDGIEVRPVQDEADQRRVLDALDEAFIDHWGHHIQTEEDVRSVLEHPYTDPTLWTVGWAGGEVAAAVVATELFDDNAAFGWRRGWLDTIGTRRPWRRQGLASALIVRSLATLRDRGLTSAGLGVDTANPSGALGLYERLGFRTDQRFMVLQRPLEPDQRPPEPTLRSLGSAA
jgi:ribosomal protein S18 acetylase RimI-like enzyme